MEYRHNSYVTGRCFPTSSLLLMARVPHIQQCCPLSDSGIGAVVTHGGRARMDEPLEEPWDAVVAPFALPAAGEWQTSHGRKLVWNDSGKIPKSSPSHSAQRQNGASEGRGKLSCFISLLMYLLCVKERGHGSIFQGVLQHLSGMHWHGLTKKTSNREAIDLPTCLLKAALTKTTFTLSFYWRRHGRKQ